MAVMLSTVLTGGTRYETRLLLHVKEFGSDEIYYAPGPVIADEFEMQPEHFHAVKTGMRDAFDAGGTGARLFQSLPGLVAGGKTGTVQVAIGLRSPNATVVAFAPFEEPELAMSVVIENGARGLWSGFVAEDIFAYYFGHVTLEEALGLPEEINEIDED
jgi:penicillin-binding protein 2